MHTLYIHQTIHMQITHRQETNWQEMNMNIINSYATPLNPLSHRVHNYQITFNAYLYGWLVLGHQVWMHIVVIMHTLANGKQYYWMSLTPGPNYRGIPSIKCSLMCPSHFPHRHYTHSQQPVHCTKPCGGHGQADELSRYTTQCEGEDQRTQQGWRAAARAIYLLLDECQPLLYDWMGGSWRAATLMGRRGCP